MRSKLNPFTGLLMGLVSLASSVNAATMSWSVTQPTVDGGDVANFIGTTTDAGNVAHPTWGAGDDEGTYLAGGRPNQGQTFTTGSNAGGYNLTSITLQHVQYATDTTWYDLGAGWNGWGTFWPKVGTLDGANNFTPLVADSAVWSSPFANGTVNNAGTAQYVTFTFDAPIFLAANSQYAFSVGSNGPFMELNGTGSDNYAGGYAFGNYDAQAAYITTGDRVFHANLFVVPEPSAALLGGLGMLALLRRRR